MVFLVVMYRCESWTIKKTEYAKIDAFKPWCWRRLLRVPWTARRSTVNPKGNQSWIFIGRTDAEAETPILWPPDAKNWKRPWCWERLKAGGEGDDRGLDGWMVSPTQWTWVWVSSECWLMASKAWHAAVNGVAKSQTRLSDWTELESSSPLYPLTLQIT